MHNKSFFNRFSSVFVALFYLSFYLFSPLFHHHHEDLGLEEGEVDYHSHLILEISKQTNTTKCHHQLANNDEHNHSVEFNILVSNLPPRFVSIGHYSILFDNICDLEFESETQKINYVSDLQFGKTLKDKCVHSAANVSPPFILAS